MFMPRITQGTSIVAFSCLERPSVRNRAVITGIKILCFLQNVGYPKFWWLPFVEEQSPSHWLCPVLRFPQSWERLCCQRPFSRGFSDAHNCAQWGSTLFLGAEATHWASSVIPFFESFRQSLFYLCCWNDRGVQPNTSCWWGVLP